MQNQNLNKQISNVYQYLQSNNLTQQSIYQSITLNTLLHCILDNKFHLLSQHKLKFFSIFKSKTISSIQYTNPSIQLSSFSINNQISNSKLGLSNILCCFKLLIQQNMIFLYNQNQWKSFIELLLKLILGKSYSLTLNQSNKYLALKTFLETISHQHPKLQSLSISIESYQSQFNLINKQNIQQINSFISGLKSSDMFKQLFRTCPSPQNYHYLFELCFVFLCHSYARKVEDSDKKVVQNFLDQFFLYSIIDHNSVQIYYKLLKNYISFFYKQFNIPMINLFLKVSSIILVEKINQSINNDQVKNQIDKIKQKLNLLINEIKKQQFLKLQTRNSIQNDVNIKNFEYFFISNALLNKQFNQSMSSRLDLEFNDKILLKMFSALRLAQKLKQKVHLFRFISSSLEYIIQTIQKTKFYPSKALKFCQTDSFFSTNILSQCQVNIKIKLQTSKQSIMLFELNTKSKKIQFFLNIIDQKLIRFSCIQIVKNQIKKKQTQQLINIQPFQQFCLIYQKSKIKISIISIIKGQSQQIKLFQIQKFQSINSKLTIGILQNKLKISSKIQQLQKLIISTKTIKKDRTILIDKVNLLNIVTDNLYKGQINAKINDLKNYNIKINKLILIQYLTNIKLFASCYNIKYILFKTLSYFVQNILLTKYQSNIQQDKFLIQNIVKYFVIIFGKIQNQKKTIDKIIKIILEVFLKKFQSQCKQFEEKKYLFISSLELIHFLSNSFEGIKQNVGISIKFLSYVMSCSFDLFILTIQSLIEQFKSKNSMKVLQKLQITKKLIFQSSLLISDNRILKEQKNILIQNMDHLFKQLKQNLSKKQLNNEDKQSIQESIKLTIQILIYDKYQNQQLQKMRRFKLSYVFVSFIKYFISLINARSLQKQYLLKAVLKLCINKIQILRDVIHRDEEQIKAKIMEDMQIKYEDSFIFGQVIIPDNYIQDISQMQFSQFTQNKHVHQIIKNKINIASNYFELYFIAGLFQGKQTLENYYDLLDKLLKLFDHETIISPSLFYSQLLSKCWLYFIKIFEKNIIENQNQDIFFTITSILELLAKYNFDLLTSVILFKIVNCFICHNDLLLSPFLNWKLQIRLNNLKDPLWFINYLNQINQKSKQFSQIQKLNAQRSQLVLLYRTIIQSSALSQIKILTLRQIFSNKILLLSSQLLVISRQLSKYQTVKLLGNQKCKQLLNIFLQNIKSYILNLQEKVKRLKFQSKPQPNFLKQSVLPAQITVKKFQMIQQYLNEQKVKLFNDSNRLFDSNIFINSQAIQLIEDYVAKIVRIFQIQALQNDQKLKYKMKFQKTKNQNLIEQKKINLKDDKKKKQPAKKQEISKTQIFKKILSSDGKKQSRPIKKPLQININQQNNIQNYRFPSNQILVHHIQNLNQTIRSLETLLSQDLSQSSVSFKRSKVFFTNQNLNQLQQKQAEFQYVIDEFCDINGFKPLIKRKEINVNLPKTLPANISEKKDLSNTEDFKNIIQHLRSLKYTCQFKEIKIIPNSPKFKPLQFQIGNYVDYFKVTYITSSQFYQGQLRVYNYHLCKFVQNRDIDPSIYGQLMALQSEQRKKSDLQKEIVQFQIHFDKNQAQFIKKSYLKVQNSIQIYASNRSYFFVFKNQKQRDSFASKIYQKNQLNQQNVNIYLKLWQKGIVSNFEYLMFLNKYSERSFSDISQYYVFPWTVSQYKTSVMDADFIKNSQNFRDLSKPIGKINSVKFNKIKCHFQSSKRFLDADRPNFLYGSFYSNPAIVSYYLIRLFPFSAHQYQLQNYRFDHPDRLFGSIEKNFDAVYNITGDFKQLLPEFYSSPYFLKNRNRYKLGYTQSKVLIDDIQLPKWVKTQTPQQFIFRMRKCLQSEQVTLNLNKWIDLTFGVYAQRNQAQKHDNLYNQHVYGVQQLALQNKNLSFCNKYLKQFGQIPRIIFNSEHPQNLMKIKDGRRMLKKSKSLTDMLKQQLMKQDIKEYAYNECEKINDDTQWALIKFNCKQYEKQQKSKVQLKTSSKVSNNISTDQKQINRSFLTLKQNYLIAKSTAGFGYYIFSEDNKDSTQYKCRSISIQKCQFLSIDDANTKTLQTYLLTIQMGSLYAYKFVTKIMGWKSSIGQRIQIHTKQDIKTVKPMGSYLIIVNSLEQVKLYTIHNTKVDKKTLQQSNKEYQKIKQNDSIKIQNFIFPHFKTIKADFQEIVQIYVNNYLSIFCIRNKANTFYIFDARQNQNIDFRCKFQIYLMFEQKINQILIHNMGYLLILTNKNRFMLTNMLGQIVVNIMVSFSIQKNLKHIQQNIQAVCFWSQQSSDIVFGTNKGVLYKVDLFDMAQRREARRQDNKNRYLDIDQFEIFRQRVQNMVQIYELPLNVDKVVDIKIERRGRHWKMYCLCERGNLFTLKNRYFDITRYMKIILRQRQD